LAKDLGLRVTDVLDMTMAEFAGWCEFYRLESEEHKKVMQRARSR